MNTQRETTLGDLVNAIDSVSSSIEDSESNMGVDDIYGMTPNSNLGQIVYNLDAINKTLNKLIEVINPLHSK